MSEQRVTFAPIPGAGPTTIALKAPVSEGQLVEIAGASYVAAKVDCQECGGLNPLCKVCEGVQMRLLKWDDAPPLRIGRRTKRQLRRVRRLERRYDRLGTRPGDEGQTRLLTRWIRRAVRELARLRARDREAWTRRASGAALPTRGRASRATAGSGDGVAEERSDGNQPPQK